MNSFRFPLPFLNLLANYCRLCRTIFGARGRGIAPVKSIAPVKNPPDAPVKIREFRVKMAVNAASPSAATLCEFSAGVCGKFPDLLQIFSDPNLWILMSALLLWPVMHATRWFCTLRGD